MEKWYDTAEGQIERSRLSRYYPLTSAVCTRLSNEELKEVLEAGAGMFEAMKKSSPGEARKGLEGAYRLLKLDHDHARSFVAYLESCLQDILQGEDANVALGIARGRGNKRTFKDDENDARFALAVWLKYKRDGVEKGRAIESVADERGVSKSKARKIWYGQGGRTRNWSAHFREVERSLDLHPFYKKQLGD